MHISCKVDDLFNALKVLVCIVPSQAANDIFKYALIDACSNGCLHLSATNLRVGITLRIDAEVEESGAVATPALSLFQCLERIMHEVGTGACARLCYDGFFLTCTLDSGADLPLEVEEASRFPRFPNVGESEVALDLPVQVVSEAIGQVAFAAQSTYDGNPLACVWLQTEESGMVTLAASDQHRIAVRTIAALVGPRLAPNVFQIPSCSLIDLLPAFSRKGAMKLQVDQSRNYLFLDADRMHAVVKLHVEWDKTISFFGDRIEYTAIPFLRFLPICHAAIFILPTAKLKSIVRRQEMQRCSLDERSGSPVLVVQRYLKGQKKGEEITIPVLAYGKAPTSLWLNDWNLLDVLSCPGASKELVLAVEDAVPPKLLIKWMNSGEVQQHYSYAFCARDPYLALLEISIDSPLSEAARMLLERRKRENASLRENWLIKVVREAVFARVLLLIGSVGVPTEADIRRIVQNPKQLGDAFEQLGRFRDKHARDRRFDWLVTQTAIQSFAQGGVTLSELSLGEELHIDAQKIASDLVKG